MKQQLINSLSLNNINLSMFVQKQMYNNYIHSIIFQNYNFDMLPILPVRPISRKERQTNMDRFVQTFSINYSLLLQFIPTYEHPNIKLICRGVYYLSVTCDIWCGLRGEVVDRKMENFQDVQFEESLQTQPQTRQQKQIRIHSLKKNGSNVKTREASNVKQKKAVLATITTQLPFRSTEMGFKRLLKGNPSQLRSREIKLRTNKQDHIGQNQIVMSDLLQIPNGWGIKDLLINVKDTWSINVNRANNLVVVVKRWNQFHHRLMAEIKQVVKDMAGLVKRGIRVDQQITQYFKLFQTEPYCSLLVLLAGANQNLLIEDQLNKMGKVFLNGHSQLSAISQHLQTFISKTHQSCLKMSKTQGQDQQSTWILEYLSTIEEVIQQYVQIHKICPLLVKLMAKSLFEIIDQLLEQALKFQLDIGEETIQLSSANLRHISKRSQFFEVFYQSCEGCAEGMLKLGEGGEEQNMGINLLAAKFKNIKLISHHLWMISKYFTKLTKQLQKKGNSSKSAIIRTFLLSYQNYHTGYQLFDWKNPQKVQKEVIQLKQRVGGLKGMMVGE